MQRSRLAWLAFTLWGFLSSPAAPGAEDLSVDTERRGEAFEVRARATVASPVPVVWQVLTDYERLPRFVPGISKSVVRQRQGARVTLEQSGVIRFFVFSFPIDITLDVTESPYEWIASRAIRGNVRRMTGRYELLPDAARGVVQVRYTGVMEPDFDLPPLLGEVALRATVEEQFGAMIAEIERRAGPR